MYWTWIIINGSISCISYIINITIYATLEQYGKYDNCKYTNSNNYYY